MTSTRQASPVSSPAEPSPHGARAAAARVWSYRLLSELEAAERFRTLGSGLEAQHASSHVVTMAKRAAADELRHAEMCRQLVEHFGGEAPRVPAIVLKPLAPPEVPREQRVLYEVIAVACVTETLSTALLAELVRPASDRFCKKLMRSILRDEVRHSRLGWAYLAEEHARGAPDCVGPHLGQMLESTLGARFWSASPFADPPELVGLGQLEHRERQRVVLETLTHVVFPGLEHFGIDTALGRQWCAG